MQLDIVKLEAHRIVMDINKRQFAKKLGVSHQWYYTAVEEDKAPNPRLATINKIAKALDLNPLSLIIK